VSDPLEITEITEFIIIIIIIIMAKLKTICIVIYPIVEISEHSGVCFDMPDLPL
jgi:hypothetical protein